MGYYSGQGVSNIVKVKDPGSFEELLSVIGCKMIHEPGLGFGFIVLTRTGEPSKYVTVEEVDPVTNAVRSKSRVLWTEAISEHLLPGEVLVFQHIGSEENNINAYSLAISWRGQVEFVSIDDIYKKAARKFNSEIIRPIIKP